jgi:hypothetical protein
LFYKPQGGGIFQQWVKSTDKCIENLVVESPDGAVSFSNHLFPEILPKSLLNPVGEDVDKFGISYAELLLMFIHNRTVF